MIKGFWKEGVSMRKLLFLMIIGIGITLLLHQHTKAEVMYLTYEQQEEKEIHRVQPNERTKKWLSTVDWEIQHPSLIEQLNKSAYDTSFYTYGVEGVFHLGRWLLSIDNIDVESVPYHIDLSDDLIAVDNEQMHLKQSKYLVVNEGKEEVFQLIKKAVSMPIDNTINLTRTLTLREPYKGKKVSRLFIPGIRVTGEVIVGDVYLHINNKMVEIKVSNIVREESDTVWINKETFTIVH